MINLRYLVVIHHWGRTDFSFRFLRSFSRRKAVKMVVLGHICAWVDVSARVLDAERRAEGMSCGWAWGPEMAVERA